MPLIECRNGAASVQACGSTYEFQRDRFGRFVAHVDDQRALPCFLSREDMYREVPEVAPAERQLWPGEAPPAAEDSEGDDEQTANDAAGQIDGAAAAQRKRGRPPNAQPAPAQV